MFSGPRPDHVVIDEAAEFQPHSHDWTVVEIHGNPIGVSCACGEVREVAAPQDPVVASQVPALDLAIHGRYRLKVGRHGYLEACVQSVDTRTTYGGGVDITVNFTVPPPF